VARDLLDEIVTEVPESFEPRYWLVIAKQGLAREAEARGSSAAISLFTDSLRGIVDRFQAKLARGPVGAEEREEFASQLDQALRDHDRSNVLRDGPRTILEVRGKRLLALAAATDAGEVLAIRREEAREARLDAERRPDNLSARMDAARAMVELASLSPDRDEARSTLEGAFDLLKGPPKRTETLACERQGPSLGRPAPDSKATATRPDRPSPSARTSRGSSRPSCTNWPAPRRSKVN
jgi:hypothetical protein